MYVCLCRGVSDKTVKKAIDEGCLSVAAVRDCTGAASQCCKCVTDIREMIDEGKTNQPLGLFYAAGVV